MKSLTLLSLVLLSFVSFGQHNFLLNNPEFDATFIRDAEIVDNQTLACAIDFRLNRPYDSDLFSTGMTILKEDGSADWSKLVQIEKSTKTLGFEIIKHPNGSYYFLGMAVIEFEQYGFILRVSEEGALLNSNSFRIGNDVTFGINKMKITPQGNLIASMYSGSGAYFVELNPNGRINWSKHISAGSGGSNKQPCFDFQLIEGGGLIATGKDKSSFSVIQLDARGELRSDFRYNLGDYGQSKSIQILADGNLIITGDFLSDGFYKSFIAKIDGLNGNPLWAKQIDQFDGTFHYQQTELIDNEIHWSLMGNNDPSMMDPEFQNYYLRLDFNGNVLHAYRNGERYDLADYQRLMRSENRSIIYGSSFNDQRQICGLIHTYKDHEFDPCYWTSMTLSTSPTVVALNSNYGAVSLSELEEVFSLDFALEDFTLKTEGTCEQVWEESSELEEENAITPDVPTQVAESVLENKEYARENHENLLAPNYEFSVFPNPNEGRFTIRTDYLMVDVIILDLSGKVVFEGVVEDGDQIDLSDHPTGVYIMKVTTETDNFIRRVVKN